MRISSIGIASLAAAAACVEAPPVKTSSGTRIEGVSLEEHYALSDEVREATFRGESLRKAVASMDKNGVFDLQGRYEAKGAIDSASFSISIKQADDKQRLITLVNCAEPHVCAFIDEALAASLIQHKPAVCRADVRCSPPAKK
jgi:hypothetical protein